MDKYKEVVKVLCSSETFAKLQLDHKDIQFVRVDEVLDGKAYLDAMEELKASHELDTKMCAMYLENTFLVSQYNNLALIQNNLVTALQKQPLDVRITTTLKKVENDMAILEAPMRGVNSIIFRHIEEKFARDGNIFLSQYCKTKP